MLIRIIPTINNPHDFSHEAKIAKKINIGNQDRLVRDIPIVSKTIIDSINLHIHCGEYVIDMYEVPISKNIISIIVHHNQKGVHRTGGKNTSGNLMGFHNPLIPAKSLAPTRVIMYEIITISGYRKD